MSGAFIRASPNPVPLTAGTGTTRISWNTGDGSDGLVTLVPHRGATRAEEIPFNGGPAGDADVGWIRPDVLYRFRLYRLRSDSKPIAEVRVSMAFERRQVLTDAAVLLGLSLPPVLAALAGALVVRRAWRAQRPRR